MSMKIPPLTENLQEIGTIDISKIKTLLNNHPELWKECNYRQNKYKPHKKTESIICVWSSNNKNNLQIIRYEKTYKLFESFINELIGILKKHFHWKKEIFIYKAMFANLKLKSKITPHIDMGPVLRKPQRIHIPIFTDQDFVYTKIGGVTYHLKPGSIYNFNNTIRHSVENNSTKDRINFIIDVSEVGTLPCLENNLISVNSLSDERIKIL